MAKAKTNSTDLDKKLKSADELVEGAEELISRFEDVQTLDKEALQEIKKQTNALKKLKGSLGQDNPPETKKKIDQALEKLRSLSKDDQNSTMVSESEKTKTLELLDSVLSDLNDKINEHKAQTETGQSKKKGKGQNKTEKIEKWIENLSYHTEKLEEIKLQFDIDGLIEQDQAIKEIISYLQDYISNSEYQQHKQTAYIDGLYESFEKQEETELNTSLRNEEELETDSTATKTTMKEGPLEGVPEPSSNEDGPDASERKLLMSRIRQSNFEHEIRKMPKVSEKDIKGEYNFFEVFEASARNIPQETDYAPNASTKERISTKNIYPKRRLISEQIFERFDVDTLFFIFYFQKDTYEQCLAAKELKRRAWRFHKKYLTWFKRLEAPRVTNDEYEQGTYAFFDFEPGGWCQRRKGDFTFKYSYLEDDKI